jgi:hypothetical protein
MQFVRRVALAVALTLLGAAVLSGCRSEPGIAAYVGDLKITEKQVNEVVTDAGPPKTILGNIRQQTVSWLVVGEVARRHAAANGFTVEKPDYGQVAEQLQVPADKKIVKIYGDLVAAVDALYVQAKPVQPTPADLQAIYDQQAAAGQVPPGTTLEAFAASIDMDKLGRLLGLRNALRDAAKAYHVVVNPKYRPLVMPLGGLEVPLSSPDDAL